LIGTTSTSSGTRQAKKIGIGWTNFAAVAMKTKKGGFIHHSVWQLLGFKKIQNGSHCHGNQGTKWPPNTKM
jgi:hypothetical protein